MVPLPGATPSDPGAAAQPKPKSKPAPPRSHRVAKGENLGKIAQRYDCEVKTLARANGLKAPGYSVHAGQQLKLEGCKR